MPNCFDAATQIIDLTHPLQSGDPAYPGDPAVHFRAHATLESDGYRVSEIGLGSHQGTHVDAPSHFFAKGATVDQLPLDVLIGPAAVIDIPAEANGTIGPEWLMRHEEAICPGARILLRTGWDVHYGSESYWHDHPGLSPAAARWLVERGVSLLGFDTPSPSRDTQEVHEILLGARKPVVLVESLAHLGELPDHFTLIVSPLRLSGLDGSPARVVAIVNRP